MIQHILRYFGIALLAAVFGIFGGSLAAKNAKNSQPTPSSQTASSIIPATLAQPFPGQGIPAIPAIPAQPEKGKPDVGSPTISYVQGEAGKNQVINPMLTWYAGTPTYDQYANRIFGNNFSDTKNTIYWDGKVLIRDVASIKNSDGTQQIILPVPTDIQLGSYHSVYVKSTPYGTSNTVQVQAVEHLDVPWFWGVKPSSGSVDTKVTAKIWDSLDYSFNPSSTDKPSSAKIYIGFTIPASNVKSGASGFANVFLPTPLERSKSEPWQYTVTIPGEAIYCPSFAWDEKECELASSSTMVPVNSSFGSYGLTIFYVYEFQYRGTVKGVGVLGNPGTLFWAGSDSLEWSENFTVTPK